MADRFYFNGKQWVPSGTTVLPDPYLTQWAADCAVDYILRVDPEYWNVTHFDEARTAFERESKLARGFGTFIHWMCEHILKTKDMGFDTEVPAKWTVPEDVP